MSNLCKQTLEQLEDLDHAAVISGMKLAVEVIADGSGKFCGNGCRFTSVKDALDYGDDLASRWTLVREFRVVFAEE